MTQTSLSQVFAKFSRIIGKLIGAALIRRVPLTFNPDSHTTSLSMQAVSNHIPSKIMFWPKAQHLQQPTYTFPNIFTTTLKNVIYCAQYNTLLRDRLHVIKDSISTVDVPLHRFNIFEHFKKIEYIPGVCSTFRSVSEINFYHTLIDCIPRIYLLHDQQYKEMKEIKLLCSGELKPYEFFFLERLIPDNVKLFPVSRDKNYKLQKIIFPSFLTRDFAGYLPDEYIQFLLERVAPKRPRKRNRRIFIARAVKSHKKTKSRIIHNEDKVFAAIEPYGFQKYYLEAMTIEAQIELFYDAEYVIAAHGAGLSNLIFADQIGVVELFPTPYIVPYFYFICKSRNHTYYYWCGTEKHRDSNFEVDIPAIESTLRTCLKEHTYTCEAN